MFKAVRLDSQSSSYLSRSPDLFDPPLIAQENALSIRDYLRPMAGGALYAIIWSLLFTLPLMLTISSPSIFVALAMSAFLVVEMTLIMGLSALIHHQLFIYRLRKYGPQFYNSEITVAAPAAEAFELCLAATSDLPKSKIISMDEKNGALMVAIKGNFWITVDRQVTLRVRAFGTDQSIVSVDPSIKLTPIRKKVMRLIWGDKWYPLIFRSDINWNRKIINSITFYIESVPNWDHKYDHPEPMDHGITADIVGDKAA